MNGNLTPKQISRALFEADPMNTSCRENDCLDEYDYVAQAVADRLIEGWSLDRALVTEVSEWFFNGEQFDVSRLTLAFKLIREEWP
ncbi:hypothetical protein [Marinobacter sp. DY40_1A1]|uniref:hypothetical protein n=1 Tax=Marinobacter sp. DY40_1A1 TaxID=2583229 RepID=UPI0019060894|nr:hypothetical protein [Marinobacter sp. DY40_1A1]MBK1887780.1 hypothetical protein [Marinobacter sp. DY40_1A1]